MEKATSDIQYLLGIMNLFWSPENKVKIRENNFFSEFKISNSKRAKIKGMIDYKIMSIKFES